MHYSQDDILELTGWSRTTLYRARTNGEFPEPINENAKPLQWREHEVDAYLAEKWEPSANDKIIMENFADAYRDARDEALEIARENLREEFEDERSEAIEEAHDEAFNESKARWIAAAIAREDDGGADDVDYETRARQLFDEHLVGDQSAAFEIEAPVDAAFDSRMTPLAEIRAHNEAIEAVKAQIKAGHA